MLFEGRHLCGCLGRSIRDEPSTKQAQASPVMELCLRMTAIGGAFVVIGRRSDILCDSTAVFEAEAEIVCAIRVTLVRCAAVVFSSELEIHANPDPAPQADSKVICAVGILQISRRSIQRVKKVPAPRPISTST
jgi:hypothetical protein